MQFSHLSNTLMALLSTNSWPILVSWPSEYPDNCIVHPVCLVNYTVNFYFCMPNLCLQRLTTFWLMVVVSLSLTLSRLTMYLTFGGPETFFAEVVIHLWEIGDQWQFVWYLTPGHVNSCHDRRNTKLLLSNLKCLKYKHYKLFTVCLQYILFFTFRQDCFYFCYAKFQSFSRFHPD